MVNTKMSKQGLKPNVPSLEIPAKDLSSSDGENPGKSPEVSPSPPVALFSPRSRVVRGEVRKSPTYLLSPRGRIDVRRRSPNGVKAVNDDSMTYFAVYTSYAPRFRNLEAEDDAKFKSFLTSCQASSADVKIVGGLFEFAMSESNYLCFYAPFSKMFELKGAIRGMNFVRVRGFSSINRYRNTHTEEVLIVLNLVCDEYESKTPKKTVDDQTNTAEDADQTQEEDSVEQVLDEPTMTKAEKLRMLRDKYTTFLKAQGDTDPQKLKSVVNNTLSSRTENE